MHSIVTNLLHQTWGYPVTALLSWKGDRTE